MPQNKAREVDVVLAVDRRRKKGDCGDLSKRRDRGVSHRVLRGCWCGVRGRDSRRRGTGGRRILAEGRGRRDYAASWDQAAKVFKGAVKQTEWGQLATSVRAPLGVLVSRKLKSREYTEKMPTTRVIGGKVYTWGDREVRRHPVRGRVCEQGFGGRDGDPDGGPRRCLACVRVLHPLRRVG